MIAATSAGSGAWDEMATGDGRIRAHWQTIFPVLATLGPEELARRGERARQQLEDDGVTFNLYAAGDEDERQSRPVRARPWTLDAVPLVLGAAEWTSIERGIVQRARLLDRVLADLYGPQNLLADRRYPPGLVFGSAEFLRPCRRPGGAREGRFVQHYAADLARGPDGVWRVVGDRVQAPAGAAYALHHRRALARTMGEAFAACGVRRLAGFFETWAADLRARAPDGAGNPRIALLTPGPFNEAHAEHAALARELGAALVQGADLTVRDGRVHVKTLGGLEQVGTLLRRVDAAWCDPLELRGDTALGVAGLVDAERAGRVHVANALGAALVEAPAMLAFLPALANHLLREDLLLPSIASWWCGQACALEEVLARLPSLALRPALAPDGRTVNGDMLGTAERADLVARLRARPAAFAAQERIVASVAPGEGAAGLQPQAIVLRVFATADGDGYAVMPGGLARVPASDDPLRAGLQQGGTNKDVWVLGAAGSATPEPASRAAMPPVEIRRTLGEVPSRAADDLFWLGRSVERADGCARILRAALLRVVGGPGGERERAEIVSATRALERSGAIALGGAAFVHATGEASAVLVAAFAGGGLLASTLAEIERLSSAVRDRFSVDMRRTLHRLLGDLRERIAAAGTDADSLLEMLDELLRLSAALSGLASENMTRGSGWRFLDLGRRVERGIHVARVVLAVSDPPRGDWQAALRLALELCDSTITYRTRYLAALLEAPVLDLLLLDATNPRSLAFQVEVARAHLDALPRVAGTPDTGGLDLTLAAIGRSLAATGAGGVAPDRVGALRDALTRTEADLMALSDGLNGAYFALVGGGRVVGDP